MAANDSARQLMQQKKLRELVVVLTQKVRENTTLDWTIKSNARAKIRAIVKRILKRCGYPPDMAELATDTVLKQAEPIAGEQAQYGSQPARPFCLTHARGLPHGAVRQTLQPPLRHDIPPEICDF